MDTQIALSELKAICTVISDVDGTVPDRFITPWRGELGGAFAVVAPTSIKQIQDLIDFARCNDFKLLAQGERTGLVGASVPLSSESDLFIIVSMERYKNRLEFNETDNRVVVDSGFTLDEINSYLRTFGVHIPIDVSSNPMVGGAIATNIGGSRVVKYGDARKLLLGIEVVLADTDKTVYSTLDKPRKDNSAPDFTGVFCGSFGSFGIITGGSFEVFPINNTTYTAWFSIKEDASLEELISTIQRQSGDLLLACEFIGKSAVEVISRFEETKSAFPLAGSTGNLIFVEWGSPDPEFNIEKFAEGVLENISSGSLVDDIAIVPSETTWKLRHQFSQALKNSGKLIGNDVSVSKDKISEFISSVNQAVLDYDPELKVRSFGHLGDGGLHVNVIVEGREKIEHWSEGKSIEIRRLVGGLATSFGGSFSAEHGLGSFNTQLYESLVPSETKRLVSKFKIMCDPDNVLGHSGIKF